MRRVFNYEIENGKVIITGYNGKAKRIIVPSEIDGLPVTKIGCYAFYKVCCESVILPDSIRVLKDESFCKCTLKKIRLSSRLEEIDGYAFMDCKSLTSITIPDSVTEIENGIFEGCDKLEKIKLSNNLEIISSSMFNRCKSLTSITIPDSVTKIEEWAFINCSLLCNITIPDTVTTIGSRAFYGCIMLQSITIPDSITSIGERIFEECSKLKINMSQELKNKLIEKFMKGEVLESVYDD